MLVEAEPGIFRPVPGGWGKRGSTNVRLAAADQVTLQSALTLAWTNIAPTSFSKKLASREPLARKSASKSGGKTKR